MEIKNLLNDKGFNLWADDYDKSVGLSDEDGTYPFAGYKIILNTIYNRVLNASSKTVLDIGFGTGTLTSKLYERGCAIYGQDFSDRMIELAKEKMPNARLFQGDFSKGLVEPLTQQKYDAIIATYSLHHLTDLQKVSFLKNLLMLLNEGGCIYIGDVAFETRAALQKCTDETGDEWDDDEIYFVYDELKLHFPTMQFEQMSNCAGLISLRK
jgi:putative AdoMet-dependent methyltransferase